MNYSFNKVTTLPSTKVAGAIYFETSTGLLHVAESTSSVVTFSGIKDAILAGSVLTITKSVGDQVQVDIATLAQDALSGSLASKLNIGTASDASSTQSYYGLKKYVDEQVTSKIASTYKYKGTCTYAELPEEPEVGDVWNVEDAHGGLPAGTNYAWDGEAWDALAGVVDLSAYSTTIQMNSAITDAINALDKTDSAVTNQFVTAVSQADGVISVTRSAIPAEALPTHTHTGSQVTVGGDSSHASKTLDVAIADLEKAISAAQSAGVTSFGGQTGEITVDTATTTSGAVKFTMSDKQLTAVVNGWSDKVDTTRTINTKPLSENIVLGGADILVGGSSSVASSNIATGIKTLEDKINANTAWATWE